MRISRIFKLEKTQAELDFIDIDVARDTALFIDPFFLSLRNDRWSEECTRSIQVFFQKVISLLKSGKEEEAKAMFAHLHEPNSTCLGLSTGAPRGRGVGKGNTDDIFNSIAKSRAVQTGLVKDLEDNILFVDGFGKDKLSDMTTNIIRWHLIQYTKDQCQLHNISLQKGVPSGYFWNRHTKRWEQELTEMLVIKGKVILMVPKGIASYSETYTSKNYYENYVLNFMQNEHKQLNSALVQRTRSGEAYVTKKDLKEKFPFSKQFITNFTEQHPEILSTFKKDLNISSLNNEQIINLLSVEDENDLNFQKLVSHLIKKLENIPPGSESASTYHNTVTGILEIVFYPNLIYPRKETEIHDGRKRIDITFDNAAETGIFHRLHKKMNLPCQYIFVECKNYSSDPANPELDQLAGRFSPNRGQVGFLVCRTIDQFEKFMKRCTDTYRDSRGLIIPLQDSDLILLLRNYSNWTNDEKDKFLSDRVRQIAIA